MVSPNPARDYVTVTCPGSEGFEVSVVNSSGEEVLRKRCGSPAAWLNIEHLASGVYIVSVKSGEQAYKQKIVVK